MVNRFSELRNKEIIHVCEGTRLGYLNDVCIDTDTGRVTSFFMFFIVSSPFSFC